MSSLDRLINLVKKTGDRLIVHDSITGEDVVIMDISVYESLLDGRRDEPDSDTASIGQTHDSSGDFWVDEDDEDAAHKDDLSPWLSTREILGDWPAKTGFDRNLDDWQEDRDRPSMGTPAPLTDDAAATPWGAIDTRDDSTQPGSESDGLSSLSFNMNQQEDLPTVRDEGEGLGAEEPIFYEEPV